VAIELAKSIKQGEVANVSRLELDAHTGTHVDAPRHFIPGGQGASELALEPFIGPCVVVNARAHSGKLDRAAIESVGLPPTVARVRRRSRQPTTMLSFAIAAYSIWRMRSALTPSESPISLSVCSRPPMP
jgi:arylformamidase